MNRLTVLCSHGHLTLNVIMCSCLMLEHSVKSLKRTDRLQVYMFLSGAPSLPQPHEVRTVCASVSETSTQHQTVQLLVS